jgi:hypothetical protein
MKKKVAVIKTIKNSFRLILVIIIGFLTLPVLLHFQLVFSCWFPFLFVSRFLLLIILLSVGFRLWYVHFHNFFFVRFLLFFGWSKQVKLSCPMALLKSFLFLERISHNLREKKTLCFQLVLTVPLSILSTYHLCKIIGVNKPQ